MSKVVIDISNGNPSETKDDGIEQHRKLNPSETKDDEIEKYRKSMSEISVSQYIDGYNKEYDSDDYVVTFKNNKSVLGWSFNTKNNKYHPDSNAYFKFDKSVRDAYFKYEIHKYVLSKKILLLFGRDNYCLIDLNSDRTSSDRFLNLKHQVKFGYDDDRNAIGLLPNGDLIRVSVRERKIYKYCFTDKPKNTDPWECSQIIDIKVPENLNDQIRLKCYIYRTKLFLIVNDCKILQFDLLIMNLERQYHEYNGLPIQQVIVNKNQTLLAISLGISIIDNLICIYSMENGMLIYKSGKFNRVEQVEFVTLKDDSERLVIRYEDDKYRLIDPYQVYDEIDISNDFNSSSVITQLNKKIFINNDNVCVTNGIEIDKNKMQLSNKIIYKNSIYTLPTFKIIQDMLKEDFSKLYHLKIYFQKNITLTDEVEIKNLGLCKIVLDIKFSVFGDDIVKIEKNGREEFSLLKRQILSIRLLNNQDLVLIHANGISIYTISENGFKQRYFWYNNEWNDIYKKFRESLIHDHKIIYTHYKPLIERILKNEFDDSKHSIPFPKFIEAFIEEYEDSKEIIEDVINDNLVSLKFGIKMLKKAIKKKGYDFVPKLEIEELKTQFKKARNDAVRQIIELTQDYSENYMTIISLNLLGLCDNYPDFIIKYISCTSIILHPYCKDIGNSKNTSLHSYINIYIKESNMKNTYFKPISALYKGLTRYLRIKEEIQTVSFIVPFPKICVYQDDSKNNDHKNHETEKNHNIKSKIIPILILILKKMIIELNEIMIPKSNSIWNELIYKPKSIIFCNIDSNHFYNWWNFAAIIDFKWKTFGRVYYFLNWLFFIFFYVCYSLASTLEQKSIPDFYFKLLFIISIILGSIFLIFEIRQFLWNYKRYFNDIWNLFVLGYAQAFFIVLRSNSINDDNNPRNVATKYDFVNPDGTISNTTTIIQDPDSNTNLFNWFPTSLLAAYKLLTGNSGSLSSFTYREHFSITILLVTFTFFTVIYLMNLFIGLLNIAIDDYNKEEEFLLQKAQIIMEIELFYMLPYQRRNQKWFPDWIYYDIPLTEIRKLLNAIDNKQTVFNYPPVISKELRKLVVLTNYNKLEEKIEQTKIELTRNFDKLIEEKIKSIQQDNEKKQNNELEKQIKQSKDELTQELKKMDKLEQKIESIQKNEEKQDKIEQIKQTKKSLRKNLKKKWINLNKKWKVFRIMRKNKIIN
ncbi:hypothetical protein GLOIN_2v1842993 [Rhizophagus clarus]|uniref:Ion transport domain-containing protein n=1 Tax=Rhizophagus clarus TaxID=94130 RepID=A0A8H3KSH1_9GLOM|nr:hypothetical protein GLOIN_2v1842993 [Rhizophagus clarus]